MENNFCVNTIHGCMWGNVVDLEYVDKLVKKYSLFSSKITLVDIIQDYRTKKKYVFIKDIETENNYFLEVSY